MMKKNFVRYDRRKRSRPKFTKSKRRRILLKAYGTKIDICSWNVEEKGDPEEIDKLVTGVMQEQPDVLCLQRAKLPSSNTETKNYKWLCSATSGSAILIKKSSDWVLNSFEQHCDQLCMADLTGKEGFKIYIMSCYIPPATEYVCTDLWTKLKEIIGSIPPSALLVLAGDFNAQIGKDNKRYISITPYPEFTLKKLYHETSNENGEKLTDLLRKCHYKLFITQKKNASALFTFNDGINKAQQSFIVVPDLRQSFTGEGYHVSHHKYNHSMSCLKLLCSLDNPLKFEDMKESCDETRPLVIASWNIQNATPAKVDKLLNEYNLPIVCIQELFLVSDEKIQTENYTWLSSNKLWAKNVGILVKKCPEVSVSSFEPLSEYFCAATIMYNDKPLIVISSHLPPKSDPQHDKVLSQMKELIKGVPEEINIFFGGDFGFVMNTEAEVGPPNADDYVKNFAVETKMQVGSGSIMYKKFSYMSQVTDTSKQRAHYLLVSQSAIKTMKFVMHYRWVPLFECMIVSMIGEPKENKFKKFSFDTVKMLDGSVLEDTKIEAVDGVATKSTNYKFLTLYDNDLREDITSLVSADDIEKYKDTPPPVEELSRMLKDFVLIKTANRRSIISMPPFSMLVKSLSESKLGQLHVEEIKDTNNDGRRICRLKWRGILIAEVIGKSDEVTFNLRNKAANSFFEKICQICYTVKARNSFYNTGRKPLMMDSTELADVLKIVKKSSFPSLEDVYKHIDDFILKDTDEELIFGTDFPKPELYEIAGYAFHKNGLLDFRFFISNKVTQEMDHLAVFRYRSPQYLRDMLIKNPKNFKYYLIHPCGLGGNYIEFSQKFTDEVKKEESELFAKYKSKPQPQPQTRGPAKVKGLQSQRGQVTSGGRNPPRPQQSMPSQNKGQMTSGGRNPSRPQQSMPSQNRGGRKRAFDSMGSNQNGFRQSNSSDGGKNKRQKTDTFEDRSFRLEKPRWSQIRPLVIVWPITVRSNLEDRPEQVLSENFTVEYKTKNVNGQNVTAVFVALTENSGFGKLYCIAKGSSARNASRLALDLLVKHCTIIKPNPNYLCNGQIPNFIRYKVPCQFNPRTYLILDRNETGPLTWPVIENLVERFLNSHEEEMFFDRDTYSFTEKLALVENVPKLAPSKLLVRHFGDNPKLDGRYVCVYKIKPTQDVLREVLKMRGQHPKFTMTTNRLPPGIEYNIF